MPTETLQVDDSEATWVADMREHFQQTGEVRAEDVDRLLGDLSRVVYMRDREEITSGGNAAPIF